MLAANIDVQMIEVDGQQLQVAIKRGPKGRPPVLIFNGIGANWELAKPFLTALKQTEAIILCFGSSQRSAVISTRALCAISLQASTSVISGKDPQLIVKCAQPCRAQVVSAIFTSFSL